MSGNDRSDEVAVDFDFSRSISADAHSWTRPNNIEAVSAASKHLGRRPEPRRVLWRLLYRSQQRDADRDRRKGEVEREGQRDGEHTKKPSENAGGSERAIGRRGGSVSLLARVCAEYIAQSIGWQSLLQKKWDPRFAPAFEYGQSIESI